MQLIKKKQIFKQWEKKLKQGSWKVRLFSNCTPHFLFVVNMEQPNSFYTDFIWNSSHSPRKSNH